MRFYSTALAALLASIALSAGAQNVSPKWSDATAWDKEARLEDHFWRKRVRMRVDLKEKVNQPLAEAVPQLYDQRSLTLNSMRDRVEYRQGMIPALIEAYANGMITGYGADTLDNELEFPHFVVLYDKRTSEKAAADTDGLGESEEPVEGEWIEEEEEEGVELISEEWSENYQQVARQQQRFADIENYFDVIEGRIFDKKKSAMAYDLDYITLYAKGANGVSTPIVSFRYDDVARVVLDRCQWRNRHNDAECRSLKEIFELRLFSGYVINVSGSEPKTAHEAEKRRLQMLEFEHNLWEL